MFLGLVLELLDGSTNAWTVVVIHAIELVLVVFGSPFRDEMVSVPLFVFPPCSYGVQMGPDRSTKPFLGASSCSPCCFTAVRSCSF